MDVSIVGILSLIASIASLIFSVKWFGIFIAMGAVVLAAVGISMDMEERFTSVMGLCASLVALFMFFMFNVGFPNQPVKKIDTKQVIVEKQVADSEEITVIEEDEVNVEGDTVAPSEEKEKLVLRNYDSNEEIKPEEDKEEVQETTPVKEEKKVSKTNEKDTYEVGETASYEGMTLKLLGYEEAEGDKMLQPDDGNVFLYPEFDIYNGTDEREYLASMSSFSVYCDGYKVNMPSMNALMYAIDNRIQLLDGYLETGMNMEACLGGIEVPKNWKKVEINYYGNVWKNKTCKFIINK